MGFSRPPVDQALPPFHRGKRNLFGLAPGGVYLATLITQDTVGSYPTFSPLPTKTEVLEGGMFLWHFPYPREIGIPPFHRNSPRYGPPCPAELGLSSPPDLPPFHRISGEATICSPSTLPLSLDF